jgi:hypothetical protein
MAYVADVIRQRLDEHEVGRSEESGRVALGACPWVVILSLNNFCEARPE